MPQQPLYHLAFIIYPGLLRLAHLGLPVYQIHLIPLLELCPCLLKPEGHIIFHTLLHRIKYPGEVADPCVRPGLSAACNPFYLPCSQIFPDIDLLQHWLMNYSPVFDWQFQKNGKAVVGPILVLTGTADGHILISASPVPR